MLNCKVNAINFVDFDLRDETLLETTLLKSVKHWNLADCKNLTDVGFKFIADLCPDMLSFNCAGSTNLTADGFLYILDHCKSLTSLNISHVSSTDFL